MSKGKTKSKPNYEAGGIMHPELCPYLIYSTTTTRVIQSVITIKLSILPSISHCLLSPFKEHFLWDLTMVAGPFII